MMDLRVLRKNSLTYVVADNFFTLEEYAKIQKELLDIKRFANKPEFTSAARYENKEFKKNGDGVFLDDLYSSDRSKSDILNGFSKVFSQGFAEQIVPTDSSFLHLRCSSKDTTLVNYYSDGGYYDQHRDASILSAVWFDCIGNISGGEFIFSEHDVVIEPKPNRLVLFHGCTMHGANPVRGQEGAYRISIAKFINYK